MALDFHSCHSDWATRKTFSQHPKCEMITPRDRLVLTIHRGAGTPALGKPRLNLLNNGLRVNNDCDVVVSSDRGCLYRACYDHLTRSPSPDLQTSYSAVGTPNTEHRGTAGQTTRLFVLMPSSWPSHPNRQYSFCLFFSVVLFLFGLYLYFNLLHVIHQCIYIYFFFSFFIINLHHISTRESHLLLFSLQCWCDLPHTFSHTILGLISDLSFSSLFTSLLIDSLTDFHHSNSLLTS